MIYNTSSVSWTFWGLINWPLFRGLEKLYFCTINSALPSHSRNTERRANEQSSFAVSPSWIFRGQKVAFRNRVVLSSNGHKNAVGILATGGRNRQDTDTYLRGKAIYIDAQCKRLDTFLEGTKTGHQNIQTVYRQSNIFVHLLRSVTYLQCTTRGPASAGLYLLTRLLNASSAVGYSGTPWSGHTVKWNCFTSRSSFSLSWCTKKKKKKNTTLINAYA